MRVAPRDLRSARDHDDRRHPSRCSTARPAARSRAVASPTLAGAPVKLVVGLGYIPNVQFAPFYLAQTDGSYEAAGLQVEFQNKIDPDLVTLVGQGAIDVGITDGTSVIPAVSQAIPVQYVATIYGKFPSIVFAKTSSGIKTAADLKGKKLGIPGRYGSSWIMLQALLASANLTPDDLTIVEYPDFGQGAAVAAGAVDAATGFANNEPVVLGLTGEPVTVLHVDDITPLPGPGLISSTKTLETKHDAIARFVAVTLDAMARIKAEPAGRAGRRRRRRSTGSRPTTRPRRPSSTRPSIRGPARSRRPAASARSTPPAGRRRSPTSRASG